MGGINAVITKLFKMVNMEMPLCGKNCVQTMKNTHPHQGFL